MAGRGHFVCSAETSICPICSGAMKVVGSRKRKIKTGNETVQVLIIRRLRCKQCKKIHHELPDMVIPYKRYSAETIEQIVGGREVGIICEESTIRRIRTWWKACKQYFDSVIASLREKLGMEFSIKPAPREIVRAVVNAHLWVHTRSAFLSV